VLTYYLHTYLLTHICSKTLCDSTLHSRSHKVQSGNKPWCKQTYNWFTASARVSDFS